MAYDIGPVIGVEGEAEFRKAINGININMKTLNTEMMAVASQFDKSDNSMESYVAKNKVLNKQIDEQKNKLAELNKGLEAASEKYGKNDKVTQGWQQAVNKATADLNKMERELNSNNSALDEFGKEVNQAADELDNAAEKGSKFSKMTSGLKSGLQGIGGAVGKAAVVGVKALGTAIVGAGAGLVALTESTREYRNDLSKLEQGAKTSGNSFETMKNELSGLTALTGETDSSIEALSNLMATGFNDNQITDAVNALSGAVIKFPDTLKIEGLADGLQETLATGKATGTFSELIERMGGNLDDFNLSLANATTEAEKQQVAMDWLAKSGLAEVNEQYKEANKDMLSAAEAQFKLNDSMAGLAKVAEPAIASLKGGAADMLSSLIGVVTGTAGAETEFSNSIKAFADNALGMITSMIPTITTTFQALIPAIIKGITKALPTLGKAATEILLLIITTIVAALPDLIPVAKDIIITLMQGLIKAIPDLIPAIVEIVTSMVATITSMIPEFIPLAIEIIIAITTGLVQAIPQLVAAIPQIIVALLNALLIGIPKIITFVPTLFKEIGNGFRKIDWGTLGKNIIDGIAEGIKNAAANLANSVVNAASGALTSAKKFLKIQSPSKVFRDQVGNMIGAGMAAGISDSAREVDAAMNGINKKLVSDSTVNINSIGNTGNRSSNSIVNVNVPVVLDGQVISTSSGRIQYGKNRTRSRALGVTV